MAGKPLEGLKNLPEVQTINKIIRMWQLPCSPTWEVWLETLVPVAELTIVELFTPSTVEWIEMPLGRYHGPGGKVIRRLVKRIIPGVFEAAEGHLLWRFLAPIETILFWWMVVDLALEAAYNWESLAFERAGCFETIFCQSRLQGATWYGDSPDWQTVFCEYAAGDTLLYTVDGMGWPPFYHGSVGGSVSAVIWPGFSGSIQSRMLDASFGRVLWTSEETNGQGGAPIKQLNFNQFPTRHVGLARHFKLQVKVTGGPFNLQGSGLSASATPGI